MANSSTDTLTRTPEGVKRRVTLPVGAVLVESVQRSGTLKGMIGVFWEGHQLLKRRQKERRDAQFSITWRVGRRDDCPFCKETLRQAKWENRKSDRRGQEGG